MIMLASVVLLATSWSAGAFLAPSTTPRRTYVTNQQEPPQCFVRNDEKTTNQWSLFSSSDSSTSDLDPQIMACGYSQEMDLVTALQLAVRMAMDAMPPGTDVTLGVVSVSSLYDGSASPSAVVPAVLTAVRSYGVEIEHLVGCTNGGFISSQINADGAGSMGAQKIIFGDDKVDKKIVSTCKPVDQEGIPGVSVTLCVFPDVKLKTFHVTETDMPDDPTTASEQDWKSIVGLKDFQTEEGEDSSVFLLASPAFQPDLDDLIGGIKSSLSPDATIFGAAASTVSSLSRARLFRHDAQDPACINTLADGCVGVAMSGDIQVETMMAQGAKPVGGIYQVIKGEGSTIQSIVLDETVTDVATAGEDKYSEDDMEAAASSDKKAMMAAAYAKARIPKPPLAEANFVMKTLSDDDKSFMSQILLVGVETQKNPRMWYSESELEYMTDGNGYRFEVHQVASAGVKDGSVTMSLDTVQIAPGMRMRFFVRDNEFAKKEVEAMWKGYKKQVDDTKRTPTGCFMFPSLDRGNKFFAGKSGFESSYASNYLPQISSVSGFFCNGLIGKLQKEAKSTRLHGSGTGYALLGSKSGRPFYSPQAEMTKKRAAEDAEADSLTSKTNSDVKAPRDERGELILKRREVHSGRALTISTIEWSVAEKAASPTSSLEGFMWDKETEVDRFRERYPLANLVSQCRLSSVDPTKPKPRDWIGPVKEAAADGRFVIIPECKRIEPVTGSLYKRYDLSKIVRGFAMAGAPAISVNCDPVLFGGSIEDVTKAREVASATKLDNRISTNPPILASDLLLYPYQLYKISLAGADAVNLVVGALAPKDLTYLTKIAAALKLQTLVVVTSVAQIEGLSILPAGGVDGMIVSNRELEDFSFDITGQQALDILKSDALKKFREKHGADFPILVEGRVGMIERPDESGKASKTSYLHELKEAGAIGAIVGGSLAEADSGEVSSSINALVGGAR